MKNAIYNEKRVLQSLFEAKSVVVVGASPDRTKLNGIPLTFLKIHGFEGNIFLVNPKYDMIDDIKCYPTVTDLPIAPDVALIAVPAQFVTGIAEQCGKQGVKNLVILSSGFEEVGLEGKSLAQKLLTVCKHYGMNIVGPNGEGMWSVPNKMILTFGTAAKREEITSYPVGVISQSGGIGGALVRKLYDHGFGVNYFVSVGNETDLTINDYIMYMVETKSVKVIAVFIEGLKDGINLVETARYALKNDVQIIFLKSGSSESGKIATASHTGKIATAEKIYNQVFKQAGVIQVDYFNDLIDCTRILSNITIEPQEKERTGLGVLSLVGGARALILDGCEKWNVPLAKFEDRTVNRLSEILPFYGVAENPTDLTGQVVSNKNLFDECLEITGMDENVEVLLLQFANSAVKMIDDLKDYFVEFASKVKKPIIITTLGDEIDRSVQAKLAKENIICASDPVKAAQYVGWIYQSGLYKKAKKNQQGETLHQMDSSNTESSGRLPEHFTDWVTEMEGIGLDFPKFLITNNRYTLEKDLQPLSFPVVVKALPEQLEHKTELGAVHINVQSKDEAIQKVKHIQTIVGPDSPVLIQEMVSGGFEMVLSIVNDPDFGPILSIGTGGVYIEILKDVQFLKIPCSKEEVYQAIQDLQFCPILKGYRGKEALDMDAIVEAIMGISHYYLQNYPAISELEINPMIVLPKGQGAYAVDFLIK
jgi:acyl-CoA synthetase (NDP forming)